MGKLFKLKKWLTIEETATYLSGALSEPVSKADVFRLALDGELVLSVYFVEMVRAKRGRPVPRSDAPKVPGIPIKGHPPHEVTLGLHLNDAEVLVFEDSIASLPDSVYDVPMVGGERISCEQEYQKLTGGPKVELINIDGTFLRSADSSEYFQLYEDYLPQPKPGDARNSWERRKDVVHYPIGSLPFDLVFVVRTASLNTFLDALKEEAAGEKPLALREQTTYLNMIGALLELIQTPRDGRKNDAAVIREMVENYSDRPGISARTLAGKFAEAKRSLREN